MALPLGCLTLLYYKHLAALRQTDSLFLNVRIDTLYHLDEVFEFWFVIEKDL
jgi:hypothetical protein